MIKIFPAAVFGTKYIKQLRGPIDNVDFIAVGGVNLDNICEFLSAGCIGAGLGSTLLREDIIRKADWSQLTRIAKEYTQKIKEIKNG